MYVKFEKPKNGKIIKYDKPVKIKKNELNILKESNEIIGSFDKQYEIAIRCSDEIIDMLNCSESERTIEINNSDEIKIVKITAKDLLIKPCFIGINPDDKKIFISISKDIAKKLSVSEITNAIAHELMHGYQSLKQYEKDTSK